MAAELRAGLAAALLGFLLTILVLATWSAAVMLRALGEVHGFSACRTLAAAVLAIAAFVVASLLLALLIVLIARLR